MSEDDTGQQTVLPASPISPKMTRNDQRALAKWAPYILSILATGGFTFGATSASDVNEAKDAAVRAAINEIRVEQCERDLNFWRDRAVSNGGGLE